MLLIAHSGNAVIEERISLHCFPPHHICKDPHWNKGKTNFHHTFAIRVALDVFSSFTVGVGLNVKLKLKNMKDKIIENKIIEIELWNKIIKDTNQL